MSYSVTVDAHGRLPAGRARDRTHQQLELALLGSRRRQKRKWIFEDGTDDWTWENDATMTLTRGTHRLVVKNREEGTRLDALALTRVS